jgi:hypothetical protein
MGRNKKTDEEKRHFLHVSLRGDTMMRVSGKKSLSAAKKYLKSDVQKLIEQHYENAEPTL